MDRVKEYLNDVKGRKIGIHGMRGAGKTFMSDNILREVGGFDCKIKVALENRFDLAKLQKDIATELKQDISKYEDPMLRAGVLFTALEGKKFLLIIDDVGEAFSLEEVGIPEPTESCGCKVLLMTCSWEICQSMATEIVKLKPIPKNEANGIFWKKFGREQVTKKHLTNLMEQCVEHCGGLPLAIIKIAEIMKDKYGILEWQNLLDDLKGNECTSDVLRNEVIRKLKLSYDSLQDPHVQKCFLRCAFYPTDWKISKEDLIEHWIDEGFIDDVESLQSKYDQGHAVINSLENNCLIETVRDGSSMQMPNLVRLMAFDVMNTYRKKFMVKPGKKLKALPELDQWTEFLEIVSLIGNSISGISSDVSPTCEKLSTLFLQRNPLNSIPNAFFLHMSKLRILNLSNSNIKDLPISISNLNNLTALILSRCWQLKQVPSLAKLTKLRKLDLSYTLIKNFPKGFESLVNLRSLNLYAGTLEKLPMNVLPKLSHLRRLILDWSSDLSSVNIEELKVMARLETFVGRLPNLKELNAYANFLNEGKPDRYILQVGRGSLVLPSRHMHNIRKEVRLWKITINNTWGKPILVLPRGTQRLTLEECHDFVSLCDVHSLIAVTALKDCEMVKCEGIKYLQRCSSLISVCGCSSLQSVETLSLANLRELHSLFRGKATLIPHGTFQCLKSFHIFKCPSIRKLFTLSLMESLSNLEELHVKRCEHMEWIIAGEEYIDPFNLPKLKQLKLWGLPELTTICSVRMICNGLKEIQVFDCHKLKKIQLEIPASLKKIKARKEWWDALEWLNKDILQSRCDFWCF